LRQLGAILRLLLAQQPPLEQEAELVALDAWLREIDDDLARGLETQLKELFSPNWSFDGASSSVVGLKGPHDRSGTGRPANEMSPMVTLPGRRF
jgi:hypothetical protein